jgi:hypothetical protein
MHGLAPVDHRLLGEHRPEEDLGLDVERKRDGRSVLW